MCTSARRVSILYFYDEEARGAQRCNFLIRREIYDKIRLMLKPLGRNWDNPADDDLIRDDV
jgi:hypothetical protein